MYPVVLSQLIEFLSAYRDTVWVSGFGTSYVPAHEAYLDPNLNRRPTQEEIEKGEVFCRKVWLTEYPGRPERLLEVTEIKHQLNPFRG